MKRLCVGFGALVLGGCFVMLDDTGAIAVGVTPRVLIAAPRMVAVAGVAGVSYCPTDPSVLYYGNRWWRFYGGRWHYATTYGRWLAAATVPGVFLRIPSSYPVFRSIVVHHPQYRKPSIVRPTVKPLSRPAVVKPRVAPRVAKPFPGRPVVKPGRPAKPAHPGKPAKPAKPAKPGKKPKDKDKDPKAKVRRLKR